MRRGTDGDVDAAVNLVREWNSCDAIAVSGMRDARTAGRYDGDLAAVAQILEASEDVPITNGHALRDVLQEWTVRHAQADLPGLFTNARVVVLGMNHYRTAKVLNEYTGNLTFADPLLRYGVASLLDSVPAALDRFAAIAGWPTRLLPDVLAAPLTGPGRRINHALVASSVRDADVLVATYDELDAFGLEELAGKTVISSALSDERLADLQARGVSIALDDVPQPFDVTINEAVLEAMMLAATESSELTDDDLLDIIVSSELTPRVLRPDGVADAAGSPSSSTRCRRSTSARWSRWAPCRNSLPMS